MRKRKTGSAPRGIGFPLILAGIVVFYIINRRPRAIAASSGYELSPASFQPSRAAAR